jgi:hypothetical protein
MTENLMNVSSSSFNSCIPQHLYWLFFKMKIYKETHTNVIGSCHANIIFFLVWFVSLIKITGYAKSMIFANQTTATIKPPSRT